MNVTVRAKICRVCGDKASAFNLHGHQSCEACKVFFLSNASKRASLKCPKENKCTIDIATRKCCPKCRLEKCFTIGMEFDRGLGPKQNDLASQFIDFQIENISNSLNDDSSTNKTEIKKPIETKKKYATNLTQIERNLIDNLQNKLGDAFVDERALPLCGELKQIDKMLNIPAMYSSRIIKFCHSISAFRVLKQTDQLTLLKQFFFDVLIVRFTFMFDFNKKGYPVIQNEEGTKALFIWRSHNLMLIKNQEVAQFKEKFALILNSEMDNDETIRDLIIGQLLFHPRDNITCPEFINYHYSLYCRLLLRYLEHIHPNKLTANRKYSNIMKILNDLRENREKTRFFLLDEVVDHNQLDHMLMEVLDIV